ncbi:ECF RNA polymerase sigma factor SigW [Anatilimnocola aggregata]|uniref:RNA polymerase sigma factor n=1 Tax=Anatilimnocola aggregata TaxID=2528021 RepID=A0A517YLS8_9BACT|nr:sigma-70 family RNA polymerase sigma factor [Anatilimnocola aggregata]QDU31170.1 ECF RNA polymerase sigma factor SigW [Anatilimnocola aggregata]
MTDGELVRQTLAGRLAAYAELVQRWSARVLAVCRAHVGSLEAAEDLAQESLVRGLQALATLHDPEKFGPWLRGIAVRACLDWRKAKQTSQRPFSSLDTPAAQFDPVSHDDSVETTAERAEDCQRLRAAVDELPAAYRETLWLYYSDRLTYDDLAQFLGTSRATINLRLTKARALLRQRLGATDELVTKATESKQRIGERT